MRTAVVGHVEWGELLAVPRIPAAGEIVEAKEVCEVPAGAGAIGACQMAKLAGGTAFFTSLASDETGRRARADLAERGVRVLAASHAPPHRRALISIDVGGERTITVVGGKVCPRAADPLPWEELAGADAVALYCADAEAVRLARQARSLVATARWWPTIAASGVRVDALVASARDPAESRYLGSLEPAPDLVVATEGAAGGTYAVRGRRPARYHPVAPPGPVVDTYGCGDSFLAALAFALGRGDEAEAAVELAAAAGAAVASGRGPLAAQMRL